MSIIKNITPKNKSKNATKKANQNKSKALDKNQNKSKALDKIVVKGARVHNLKNIDIEIPRDSLVVFTGLSGSGKSSLAFDTIYAEGQRRLCRRSKKIYGNFISVCKTIHWRN